MKKLALITAAILAAAPAYAQWNSGYGTGSNPNSHGVGGYTTNNGTYVQPHQQTNPNGDVVRRSRGLLDATDAVG
jgi:uncharacterized protein YdeI (BOF family)